MGRYKVGTDRDQISILPMSLNDMIASDNVVRALELIIESMKLDTADFKYGETAQTGRKPYDPIDMFKLYVYSYFNGIRSSRKIERECSRNIEVMWLIHDLRSDHKTVSEFRRNNKAGIRQAFRKFSLLCSDLGLVSKEFVAVDGSKFRASNSKDRYYNNGKVAELIDHYAKAAERYLELLDENDKAEIKETVDLSLIKERLRKANAKLLELQDLEKRVDSDGVFCITDPEAKNMVSNNGGHDISYNVQIAVEPSSHIVLTVETTNEVTDYKQLHDVAKQAKNILKTDTLTVVADRGYYSAMEFAKYVENGINPIVPKPLRGRGIMPGYLRNNFIYDQKNDAYICPRGEILPKLNQLPGRKIDVSVYQNIRACKICPERTNCVQASSRRRIMRRPNDFIADEVDLRTKNSHRILHLRKCMVEHCFGTVKRMFGFSYFLTRGLENVRTESTMHFLIYNIKRMLNTLGTEKVLRELA